jgi:flagellar biosynthesis/type III secretory pathway protein FliH
VQELLVKIPPTQSRRLRIERFFKEAEPKPKQMPKPTPVKQVGKTCFTHHFVIEDSSQPISINLSNIPKDVMPIEMAQEEIQKSYDKGFEDGQVSEMAVARAEIRKFNEKMRSMEGVIQEFEKDIDKLLKHLQTSVISISQKAASHIMRSELLTNLDAVSNRLSKVIETAADQNLVSIRLSPETIQDLESANFKLSGIDSSKVSVVPDQSLELGDCVIETDYGFLEAKVEDELDKLMQQLRKNLQTTKIKKTEEIIKTLEQNQQEENA